MYKRQGLWIIQTFLAVDLKQIELKETTSSLLELATIALVAYTVYTAAPILGKVLEALTLHTDTDLDDLLVPYLPRLFRIAAVVVLLITAADILFGQSAGALIGLLGGAGVALGLLFKDIIYDWCCAVIIYTDRLYKPKDWVVVSGLSGFFQIAEIGLRTTKLYSWEWGSIIKMPNSKMVSGIIDNWSQDRGEDQEWGFTNELNIDCITADQVEKIMAALNEMFENIDGVIYHYVWFRGVEGNTRIIKYVSYITPNSYGSATKAFHLGAMRLLDKEGIAANSVYIIADEDAYTSKLKMVKKDSN